MRYEYPVEEEEGEEGEPGVVVEGEVGVKAGSVTAVVRDSRPRTGMKHTGACGEGEGRGQVAGGWWAGVWDCGYGCGTGAGVAKLLLYCMTRYGGVPRVVQPPGKGGAVGR